MQMKRGKTMGDEISRLKTDAGLMQKLRDAREPTAAEVREQRVSFAFGSLDSKNPMTREQVRKIVECA
jgi:hypothetical protein